MKNEKKVLEKKTENLRGKINKWNFTKTKNKNSARLAYVNTCSTDSAEFPSILGPEDNGFLQWILYDFPFIVFE